MSLKYPPLNVLIIPPVLCTRFQRAAQPLLRGVQTREASVCKTRPYTRQWLCGMGRVSSLRVCVYTLCTNLIVLQAPRERCNAYQCPLADRCLQSFI